MRSKVAVFTMVTAAGVSSTLLLSGCGPTLTASAGANSATSSAAIETTPAANANDASVLAPVNVKVKNGRLTSVTVSSDDSQVAGALAPDGRSWTSTAGQELPYGTTYKLTAVAIDGEGRATQSQQTFTTVTPANTAKPTAPFVSDYGTFGVGAPITVDFTVPVTNKKEVEQRLHVHSSIPVDGAWGWSQDSKTVVFRPKDFWPSGAHVTFTGDVYGVKLNDTTYASDDITLDFNIGDKVIMTVDPATLQMSVNRNGKVENTIPVTIGKPEYETYDGIKVIQAKEGTITMKSPPGDPQYYVAPNVEYSMRLNWHGEYLHAAPWAADAFGNYAYSHGCISMTTENAKWLWDNVKVGDVVTISGAGHAPPDENDGITAWNVPWDQWVAKSTTGVQHVVPEPPSATPSASTAATTEAASDAPNSGA